MKLIYLLTGVLICCCSFSNCDKDENFSCPGFKDEVVTLDPNPVVNCTLDIRTPVDTVMTLQGIHQ